jgi:hypothetical protein
MTAPTAPSILPVVYIAGKYRAATPWLVLENIRTAQEAALQVWKMGAVALCPHSNTGLFDGECPDDVWLAGDEELLRRCDAVYLLPHWQESSGAKAEHRLAIDLGLPTFEHLGRLRGWVEEWKVTRVGEAE